MGSGSGGGGGGGGGGGRLIGGGYGFRGGAVIDDPVHLPDDEVTKILKRIPKEYLEKQFCNSLIRSVYEELFILSVDLLQNRSWDGIAKRHGVVDGPGCLDRLSNTLIGRAQDTEPNRKARGLALVCLGDFLMLSLNNDVELYVSGSSKEIISKVNPKIFGSTSGYFLGMMIWQILRREKENMPEAKETKLREAAQKRADGIINSFESKFYAKEQTTYRDLFRVICKNMDWFLEGLRK